MSTTITLYPTKDAFVDSANPTTNYGANNYLEVEDGKNAWLGYDWSALIPAGQVILSAVLSVRPFYGGTHNLNIQRCTDLTWTENGITWNNAPNASCIADKDILSFNTWGPDSYHSFDVATLVQNALTSGGIGWRIKVAQIGGYNPQSWLSVKEYTATGCSKLEITFAPAGTAVGWIDVPVVDGYIDGTYSYNGNPASRGFTVYDTGNNIVLGMSSSMGYQVEQAFFYANTLISNLNALGMPVGATIIGQGLRMFENTTWNNNGPPEIDFFYSTSGALGTTITLGDWDFPGCTAGIRMGSTLFNSIGWIEKAVPAINPNGYTNMGLKPINAGTNGGYCQFSSSENPDENAPVLRIYFEYTVASTFTPRLATLGAGMLAFAALGWDILKKMLWR